ncbi:MAG: glycosyltransferase family 2 protein [Bacteroidia bacterium]|nr:glycosyltransferase family 2 protein [Bacteroidia bacterium]
MILISVILPNYNHARFLKQRIESILCQTFQDFELIILDDASTDNSRQIIEQYRHHPKVSRIIYNRRNSGSPFKQWNKGIQLAQGKYIWIAESDDYCKEDLLSTLITLFDKNAEIGIAYCRSAFIDENNNFLYDDIQRNSCFIANLWNSDFFMYGKEAITKYLYKLNIIPNTSSVIFSKSIFQKIGGAPTNMRQCGDWWVWIKMLTQSNLVYSAKQLNFFRIHSHTTRILDTPEKIMQRVKEEIIINQLLMNYIENVELTQEKQRLISLWIELQLKYKPIIGTLLACPAGYNFFTYWREILGYLRYLKIS